MADPNDVEAAPGGEQTRKSHADTTHEAVREEALEPPQNTENTEVDGARAIEVEKVVVLSFRGLQLRRIAELQDELLKLAVTSVHLPTANVLNVNESNASPSITNAAPVSVQEETKKIDDALFAYAEALRNYETLSLNALSKIPVGARLVGAMDTNVAENERTLPSMLRVLGHILGKSNFDEVIELLEVLLPMGVVGQYRQDRRRMKEIVRRIVNIKEPVSSRHNEGLTPSQVVNVLEATGGDLGFRELDQKGREQRARKQAFIQRIIMALFGGLALIGPMLIMTLHPSRNTSLITVSIATFYFALGLAMYAKDSSGKDVLGATAAYAAVLVVFVGTSIAPAISG